MLEVFYAYAEEYKHNDRFFYRQKNKPLHIENKTS